MINRKEEYLQRINFNSGLLKQTRKKLQLLPFARIITFLLIAFFIFQFIENLNIFYLLAGIFCFFSFLGFGLIDNRLKQHANHCKQLIHINQREIGAINGDFSGFDSGLEFIDVEHNYSHDLDIFGVESLFQLLNRTSTIFGKLRLAELLRNAYNFKNEIKIRQQATMELAGKIEFRQKIRLIFYGQTTSINNKTDFTNWLQSQNALKNLKLVKFLANVLPILTTFCIVLSIFGIIPFPAILIIAQLVIVAIFGRKLIKTHAAVTSNYKIIRKYSDCLLLIESTAFESSYLQDLKRKLIYENKETPGEIIKRLARILKYMDSNLNILAAILLNSLFMFNLHLLLAVERWKSCYKDLLPEWFDIIGDIDAASCLANFSYNNPEYCYPEPIFNHFEFVTVDIGHPLIPKESRVLNSFEIKGWNQFYIITGANMSGKSTFLRTIGINYILAMIGAPVVAQNFYFYPVQLHSSIRTNDSLTKKESYFYAELKRLKQIINELEKGENRLILLDEILKGTNSKDKQAGSIALIKQLLKYNSVGLFATHDLALGELETHFPVNVKNLCFEIEIQGDQMLIDYKLHKGICKNLNATFLMKNMGILIDKKE